MKIEYLSQSDKEYIEDKKTESGKPGSRLKTFIYAFLISLILGLIINFARPAVYQSSATLLTSAPSALDDEIKDVDFQNVAIQKQKLLGHELLTETLSRLHALPSDVDLSGLSLSDIRNMLQVQSIEDTNLLNMYAEGPDPEVLPIVINTWIDVYLEARALSVKNSTNNTVTLLNSELEELEKKIEKTRLELDAFRKKHDISSIVREENESPAKLKSLTDALNKANEELVKAKAKLDAVNEAIADGQAVVPDQDQRILANLEERYQDMVQKLEEFDQRYTRDYLQYNASLKHIPEQIKRLKNEIQERRSTGKRIVRTEASREYYAAKQVVEKIRKQLDNHKQSASNFATLFSKHEKLVQDLESMEELYRETKDRLVSLQSKQFDKFPQVDVVERASVNKQAIRPDYVMGAFFVFMISLAIAFFTVWLIEFLTQDQAEHKPFEFPFQAWFTYTEPKQEKLAQQPTENKVIDAEDQAGLPQLPAYQTISDDDLVSLLKTANSNAEQLILLLLSGLTLKEIAALQQQHIDFDEQRIEVVDKKPRSVLIGKRLFNRLQENLKLGMLWGDHDQLSEEELNALLYCLAVDVGQYDPDLLLADLLRQTYLIYLVGQGLQLSLLEQVVGYLSPLELAGFAEYSPAGQGCGLDQVQLIHPACL